MPNKLYLGLGGHWILNPVTGLTYGESWDFGGADLSYRWYEQGNVRIRPGRYYEGSGHEDEGRGRHYLWLSVHDDLGNYIDDPSQWRVRFGGASGGVISEGDSSNEVLDVWIPQSIASISAELVDDPMAAGGRIFQYDDETFHLSPIWGRRGQSAYCRHLRHATHELVEAHNQLVMPYKAAYIEALKAAFPNDSHTWYNIPFTGNKQPPYNGGWWAPTYEPPSYSDLEVSEFILPQILSGKNYIDGHIYMSSPDRPMHTQQRRVDWFRGQMQYRRAIMARANAQAGSEVLTNVIFRQWLYVKPSTVFSFDGVETPWTHIARDMFIAAVEEGETEVGVDGGMTAFASWAASEGYDPGTYWKTFIRQPAIDAGFIENPGGVIGPISLYVAGVSPSKIYRNQTVSLTVTGGGFSGSTTVTVSGTGVTTISSTLSGTEMLAVVTVSDTAPTGARDLVIQRGSTTITLPNAITIMADAMVEELTLESASPEELEKGATTSVVLTGTGFTSGMVVGSSAQGVTIEATSVISSSSAVISIAVSAQAPSGSINLTAVTPGETGQTYTASGLVSITPTAVLPSEVPMPAIRVDLTRQNDNPIEQGASFVFATKYWTDKARTIPKDLTGYTARMQIRDSYDSPDPVVDLTTEGQTGYNIELGDEEGTVIVRIPHTVTAALPARFKGVYDIELIDTGGEVERYLYGDVEVTPEVTR